MAGPEPIRPGARLGPYEIVALLGKGGMGEVYRARDPRLGREVAIKVSAQQFTDRFEREARAIAALNHPNICTLYDVGPNYLVMELVEGPTLAERIGQGQVPFDEALGLAKQIADGLEAAHEKGITHRDLKPANVKIRPDGSVKVLDFGLAKTAAEDVALSSDSPTMMSIPGMILGTAGYMAPEQARGKPVDKRADIWAFGVVQHEMLTAKRLFQGEDVSHTLAAVIMKDPDLSGAPMQVVPLLKRCLEKDPRKRLRDIGDWQALLVEEAATGTAPLQSRLGTEGRVGTERGKPWVWIAVAGVLAIVATGLGFVHFRETAPETPVLTAFIPPPDKTTFNIRGGLSQVSFPALAPDGRRLVFGALNAEGKSQLWVRSLGALTAQPLAGTDNATHPFWSPDSKLVGFFAGEKLKKIDASGGTAITLCDAADGRGGTWSQNGIIVFGSDRLYAVSAAGGKPSALTAAISGGADATTAGLFPPGLFTPRWPSFLPDGRHYLYLTGSTDAQKGSVIRVGTIDSNAEGEKVADARSNAVYAQGHLLYLREDSLVAQPFDLKRLATTGEATPVAENVESTGAGRRGVFSVSENGLLIYAQGSTGVNNSQQWIWFDHSGKRSGTLSDSAGFLGTEFSPDGKSLATVIIDYSSQNADIWLYDVARGLRTRFTFDPANESNPVWSPDGRSIFFRSTRKGAGDLYRKLADGSGGDELLYADPLNKSPSSVSPDGKFLLYFASRAQKSTVQDLWVLPLEGERKPFPFVQTAFSEQVPRFSPDGHWIAYQSNESGRYEIYVEPFSGSDGSPGNRPGGKRQISTAGGLWPRWRRDGKELFYVEASGRLMAAQVSVKGAAMEVGAVSPLFNIPVRVNQPYDVSADGQRFLVVAPAEQNAAEPLTLVQNWMGLLKK